MKPQPSRRPGSLRPTARGCAALVAALLVLSPVTGATPPLRPVVEIEEELYTYVPANNGAGPMWCAGSTCLVRSKNGTVFASGLETIPEVPPLNNCRWTLFARGQAGWQKVRADDTGRTREPSPLALLDPGVFLSANPTLTTQPEPNGGPARPELFEFSAGSPDRAPARSTPAWKDAPRFTEHSYRSFAADAGAGELLLLQNIGYTHAEWTWRNREGAWAAHGQLKWPWGASYAKPQPIRVCYPAVALRNHAAHVFGVSDILEPNPAWRAHKKELTGRDWDYDFRRLFYAWTPDLRNQPFKEWIEIASREDTGGFLWPCDLHLGPDSDVHLLWTERAIDERLRPKFIPNARQSHTLHYAVLREGQVVRRHTLTESTEDKPGVTGSGARFHAAPGNRLFVVHFASGTGTDGKPVLENRILEIGADHTPSPSVPLGLKFPLNSYFTATPRAGSAPSPILDMLGQRSGGGSTISYARVRIF